MTKTIKSWIVRHILNPIIYRDYALRDAGLQPDRMHWADALACRWGFFWSDDL